MAPSSEENRLLGMARIVLALAALGILAACGGGTPITSGSPTPSPTLPPQVTNQFPIPTASSRPAGITLGADGQIWFTEFAKSKMGRLVNSGKVQEIVTPTKNAEPNGIASGPGPNINIWFTESNSGKVGQITVAGPPYTEYQLPDPAARPIGIALGSDGNMWVTDQGTNSVWRVEQILVKPHVRFTQYHLTGNAQPEQITNGPDGALWFTEPGINSIGRLPIRGRPLNEYKIPTAELRPDRHRAGNGQRALVYRAESQADRPDLAQRQHHRRVSFDRSHDAGLRPSGHRRQLLLYRYPR